MANYTDVLLAIKDHIAAFNTLASEDVNAKLEEIKALRAEVAAKAEAVATADAIEKLKIDADAYVMEKHHEIETQEANLSTAWDDLAAAKAQLEANVAELEENRAGFDALKHQHAADLAAKQAALDDAIAKLDAQRQAAVDAQAAADRQYEMYAAREKEFVNKLAAIQKVVS